MKKIGVLFLCFLTIMVSCSKNNEDLVKNLQIKSTDVESVFFEVLNYAEENDIDHLIEALRILNSENICIKEDGAFKYGASFSPETSTIILNKKSIHF
jgi:hypothetical protein